MSPASQPIAPPAACTRPSPTAQLHPPCPAPLLPSAEVYRVRAALRPRARDDRGAPASTAALLCCCPAVLLPRLHASSAACMHQVRSAPAPNIPSPSPRHPLRPPTKPTTADHREQVPEPGGAHLWLPPGAARARVLLHPRAAAARDRGWVASSVGCASLARGLGSELRAWAARQRERRPRALVLGLGGRWPGRPSLTSPHLKPCLPAATCPSPARRPQRCCPPRCS